MKVIFFILTLSVLLIAQKTNTINGGKHESLLSKTLKTTTAEYKFGQVVIKIRHQKNESRKEWWCSVWLKVWRDTTLIDQRKYLKIEALGGYAGIFIPLKQPLEEYFIVSKLGDYDGRTLLIDRSGKITDLPGGYCFTTNDKKYLFIEHAQDCCDPFMVFNLHENKVVFNSEKVGQFSSMAGNFEKLAFYKTENEVYVQFISDIDHSEDQSKIYKYDFNKNKLIRIPKNKIKGLRQIDMDPLITPTQNCECMQK